MKNIIFIAPPAAGKGTQAKLASSEYNIPHISTGDLLREEMAKEEAVKQGAEHQFIERYPDVVSVYTIGDVSKEICTGPHVENTGVLGQFKIKKEEASSSGVRRIKAILA